MSIIATEERTNQALVSALLAYNVQPSVPGNKALVSVLSACSVQHSTTELVVRNPTPNSVATAGLNGNPPDQATISTVAQTYLATNTKLQNILKKLDAPLSLMRVVVCCQS